LTSAIAATPIPFVIGEGVLYAAQIDPTAIGQAILAFIVIVGYVLGARKQKQVATKTQEIHVLVNSQKDHLEARIAEQAQMIDRQDARIDVLEKLLVVAKLPSSLMEGTK
jgi:hypothetical protein